MQDFSGYEIYDIIHLAQDGNRDAQSYLTQKNLRLVYSVAQRFLGRGVEFDDLVQVGCIGLLKAINHFNTDYSVRFSTYAVPMIMGEMRRLLRDDGPIKVSRRLKTLAADAARAKEELSLAFGREPTIGEISDRLLESREDVIAALEAARPPASLYEASGEDDSILLIDKISGGTNEEGALLNQISLETLVEKLPEREQTIIHMRYFDDKTQRDVAERLGISQVQVSRLERKILTEMKRHLSAG